jgi:ClpP class serine protease
MYVFNLVPSKLSQNNSLFWSHSPTTHTHTQNTHREFQTVTAGKFKRTLTPTKKVSKDDMAKSKEDIEEIFQLFKGWVAQNRPQLNIEEVATGETWFGPAALEKGLCDEIKTVDDILLDYVDLGYKVYDVKYEPPPEVPGSLSFLFASSENDSPQLMKGSNSIFRQGIRWLVQSFAEEVQATLSESKSIDKRYLVKDDTADNVKASSDTFFY